MFNNTSFYFRQSSFAHICNWDDRKVRAIENESYLHNVLFSIPVIITALSPMALAGNALILAVIWKKNFARTPFHILLSGLALTDFCTGLLSQPFYAAASFMCLANPRVPGDKAKLITILKTTGECGSIFFLSFTVLLITLMSVERWLHMSSRRSFFTSCRGYSVMIVLLLIPISTIIFRVLENESRKYKNYRRFAIIAPSLTCYLTTSFAYYKVYRIIRCHQQRVQATSQNYGRQAIDLAKYKKSVASMVYIFLLFTACFLPYIIFSGVYLSMQDRLEVYAALKASIALTFLSSSLNPALYLWRMKDIYNGAKNIFCRRD